MMMMTPCRLACPESPMSIDKTAWHLSSDEAAGAATFLVVKREATLTEEKGYNQELNCASH